MFKFNEEEVATEFKTEVVPLTLEIAKHYDRMATLKGDRDPDTSRGKFRVAWLADINRARLFHSPSWSTVRVTSEKGKIYRVDGGGSSRMLVQSGPDFPEGLYVYLRHFRAPTIEAAINLYEQFNPRGSTRTFTDLIKNRSEYETKLRGISPTNISTAIRGIRCHYQLHNPEEEFSALDFIKPQAEFIRWVKSYVGIRYLQKPATVGTIYSTWLVNKSAAEEFWTMVHDSTGETKNYPPRALSTFLRDLSLAPEKINQRRTTKRAVYIICHTAWNAWRQGKTTSLKYYEGCPLPKAI